MKEGINDLILKKMMDLQNRTVVKIGEMLKGEKPFAQEKVDPQVIVDTIHGLGYLDVHALIQEFGQEKVEQLIYEAKRHELKRQGVQNGNNRLV